MHVRPDAHVAAAFLAYAPTPRPRPAPSLAADAVSIVVMEIVDDAGSGRRFVLGLAIASPRPYP